MRACVRTRLFFFLFSISLPPQPPATTKSKTAPPPPPPPPPQRTTSKPIVKRTMVESYGCRPPVKTGTRRQKPQHPEAGYHRTSIPLRPASCSCARVSDSYHHNSGSGAHMQTPTTPSPSSISRLTASEDKTQRETLSFALGPRATERSELQYSLSSWQQGCRSVGRCST